MTITNISDREIALQARVKELEAEVAQMNTEIQNQYRCIHSHAEITFKAEDERDTLRQQLFEAQALIEASRKQEAVAWKYIHIPSWNIGVSIDHPEKMDEWDDLRLLEIEPLFAAPVVAPDVLKEVLDALKLCYEHCRVYHPEVERNNVGQTVRKVLAAMGGAND